MIDIRSLTKRYGRLEAVSDLSLRVRRGEIYGFLGPNGAGKTSTIKIIAGLLKPTAGRVEVAGHDVAAAPERAKRELGYIPDEPHPYERLTGREFLLTVGALYGIRGPERERRLGEALDLFDLGPWADEITESYSHGMKQKLMIAGALFHRPSVIVADEPLVGLDPKSAIRLKQVFRKHVEEGGSIMLATHILEIAEKICDRVGIILEGKLAAEGTMDELRSKVKEAGPGTNLESIFMELTSAERANTLIEEL